MSLLKRLPGSRREPHGIEWQILRRTPKLLLLGTLIPLILTLLHRWLATGPDPVELAKQIELADFLAVAVVILHWTVMLTVGIFCAIVTLMKGPAYVADRYDLPDRSEPVD